MISIITGACAAPSRDTTTSSRLSYSSRLLSLTSPSSFKYTRFMTEYYTNLMILLYYYYSTAHPLACVEESEGVLRNARCAADRRRRRRRCAARLARSDAGAAACAPPDRQRDNNHRHTRSARRRNECPRRNIHPSSRRSCCCSCATPRRCPWYAVVRPERPGRRVGVTRSRRHGAARRMIQVSNDGTYTYRIKARSSGNGD